MNPDQSSPCAEEETSVFSREDTSLTGNEYTWIEWTHHELTIVVKGTFKNSIKVVSFNIKETIF